MASSGPRSAEAQEMRTFFLELNTLLELKESDSIAESRSGKPNLNSDIRRAMDKIRVHARFRDLTYGGEFQHSFQHVWSYLEELVGTWKNDDNRDTRYQQAEQVQVVHRRLRDTELDGVNCLAGGEYEESW